MMIQIYIIKFKLIFLKIKKMDKILAIKVISN